MTAWPSTPVIHTSNIACSSRGNRREKRKPHGELVERVLSTSALAEYAAAVLEGYAALDAAHRPRQPEVEGGRHVRFACELRGESLDCGFQPVAPD